MNTNYLNIEKAIQYIEKHFKEQPTLDDIAGHLNLSPFHVQKLFTDWAGVSPKKFLQYLSVNYAKSLLKTEKQNLFTTTIDTGLSSTSRLHDLFVNIEGMTPGEYRNEGKNLVINYSFSQNIFGSIIIASTKIGFCHLRFIENKDQALNDLKEQFPKAHFEEKSDKNQKNALLIFKNDWDNLDRVKLHLKGTDFQLKVWEALLTIPLGELNTYGQVSKIINKPNAARAVGTAIGSNPIAFLIPCHRVIQSSGKTGGYRWNPIRKKAIIGWEASVLNQLDSHS
jgi:AraC family transcriptional regulator of adaptative response/methylated-DNA-[protein]-cysteine methyltransferase